MAALAELSPREVVARLSTPVWRRRWARLGDISSTAVCFYFAWFALFASAAVVKGSMQNMSLGLLAVCGGLAVFAAAFTAWLVHESSSVNVTWRGFLTVFGLWPAPRGRSAVARVVRAIMLGAVLAGVAWLISHYVTSELFPRPPGLVDHRADGYDRDSPVSVFFGQGVENGLPEELIFRTPVIFYATTVMPALSVRWLRRLGGVTVILATALVFAASHSEWGMWNMSSAFCAGILFGMTALLTRSVWPSVIGHTVYNTLALYF